MKILVADDDPISRKVIEACLSDAGYDVTVAVDGAEALEMISKPDSPRLLVLDRTMPHVDGVDVCRAIRQQALEPDVYIILLTGRGEREDIVEGFEAGADDYMTKPFDIPELKARVRTGARIVERQAELIAAREQLRAEAMYDSLTGLLNRVGVLRHLQEGSVARRALRNAARADHGGHRPLQGDERPVRASGRRHGARGDGAAPADVAARVGFDRPIWRRGVRDRGSRVHGERGGASGRAFPADRRHAAHRARPTRSFA